jgi:hypothetical protein
MWLRVLETDGYLEEHDIDFAISCDDGTLPDDSALARWHDTVDEATSKTGFPLHTISRVLMKEAGYVDIVARPIRWPINTWPLPCDDFKFW